MQTIVSENDDRIVKLSTGKIAPRKRDKKYEDLDNKLIEIIDEYEVNH